VQHLFVARDFWPSALSVTMLPAIRFDVFAVFAQRHVSVANMACACPVQCIGVLSRPAFRLGVRFAAGRGEAFRSG
jgi:hypothetical protein